LTKAFIFSVSKTGFANRIILKYMVYTYLYNKIIDDIKADKLYKKERFQTNWLLYISTKIIFIPVVNKKQTYR
jgi:hypothetical protein